jgi:hypothetical protein
MVEGNVEVKKSSSMGIVGELLRPFGSKAYKETREAGGGRFKSVIKALAQASMPATYSMMEKIISYPKEESSNSKEEGVKSAFSYFVGLASAVAFDSINNVLAVTLPEYPISRWAYGQIATRLYEK